MTLSEAARTGRRFFRKSATGAIYWIEGKHLVRDGEYTNIDGEMVVANDWECEPRKLEITASILRGAVTNLGTKATRPADVVAHIIRELEL